MSDHQAGGDQPSADPVEKQVIPMQGRLHIGLSADQGPGIELDLNTTEGYVLGRSDAKSTYTPDVDLAAFGAHNKGVSRRHAALVWLRGALHVVDLHSVNGTFLNGERLEPETPSSLASGDQLTLGDLPLVLTHLV